jgi:hypothetical protein
MVGQGVGRAWASTHPHSIPLPLHLYSQNIRTHEYQVKQHNYIVKHFVSSEYGKRVYFAVKVVVTEWLWKKRMLSWWLFGD